MCSCVRAGGLQVDLPHLPERWLLQSVEGELCHHGASHPVCCHPVLCTRAVQGAAGRLLWLSGEVSVTLFLADPLLRSAGLSVDVYLDWCVCFKLKYLQISLAVSLLSIKKMWKTDRRTFLSVSQSPTSNSKVTGRVHGWYHGSHVDLSSGHGASQDGCNAKGNVRSSLAANTQLSLGISHI